MTSANFVPKLLTCEEKRKSTDKSENEQTHGQKSDVNKSRLTQKNFIISRLKENRTFL